MPFVVDVDDVNAMHAVARLLMRHWTRASALSDNRNENKQESSSMSQMNVNTMMLKTMAMLTDSVDRVRPINHDSYSDYRRPNRVFPLEFDLYHYVWLHSMSMLMTTRTNL
jgi:hypothetical protein